MTLSPTMQYAVDAALKEFADSTDPLDQWHLDRVLTRNGLAIVTLDAAKAGADCEAATSKAFSNGVDALLSAIEDDPGWTLRREGTGEPERTLTFADIETIAHEAFVE